MDLNIMEDPIGTKRSLNIRLQISSRGTKSCPILSWPKRWKDPHSFTHNSRLDEPAHERADISPTCVLSYPRVNLAHLSCCLGEENLILNVSTFSQLEWNSIEVLHWFRCILGLIQALIRSLDYWKSIFKEETTWPWWNIKARGKFFQVWCV